MKDAVDALDHLAKLPEVDATRIALVGFSWGAMVAKYAASRSLASTFSPRRFAAVASFYPGCGSFLQYDTDRPLLVLMGAADDESPPASCVRGLEWLKERDAPVQWQVYPEVTHSWDTDREIVRTTNRGVRVKYVPNVTIRDESARRLFEFLDANLVRAGVPAK